MKDMARNVTGLTLLILASPGCAALLAPKQNEAMAAQMSAQHSENVKVGFTQTIEGNERTYEQFVKNAELADAKHKSVDGSLPAKAKKDPLYPVVSKRYQDLVEKLATIKKRHDDLRAWAEMTKATPTGDDQRKLSMEYSGINQDFAAVTTEYNQLQIELIGLKSRNPS